MSSLHLPHYPTVGPTSFQLAKFSFATVSGEGVKPIPWTHIADKGHLFAVFEGKSLLKQNDGSEEESRLKVLADRDVVEDLNLGALGHEAINAALEMDTLPSGLRFPRVTIIVQEPCIAVRFPLQYGQIRRFQMKFKQGSDFYKALALFSQAGCPLTQAGSNPPQAPISRPHTTSSAIVRGATAPQTRETLPSAPPTADSSQRTLVPSVGASTYSSGRPSSLSSRVLNSETQRSIYPAMAHGPSRDILSSGMSEVSSVPLVSNCPLVFSNHVLPQHHKRRAPLHESPAEPFLSSSDPAGPLTSMTVSSAPCTSQPAFPSIASRPSTAPACVSQELQQMLPPKRELPFKVPSITSQTGRKDQHRVPTTPMVMARNSHKSASTGIVGAIAETEQGFDHEPSDTRKTAPAKRVTRATRGSRNGATTSSSWKKSSALQVDCAVPSVEKLLRRSQRVSGKEAGLDTTGNDANRVSAVPFASETAGFGKDTEHGDLRKSFTLDEKDPVSQEECLTRHQHSNTDTQALLARVDERLRRRASKRKDHRESPEEPTLLPLAKRAACSARLGLLDPQPSHDEAEKPMAATKSARTGEGSPPNVPCTPEAMCADAIHDHTSQGYDKIRPSPQEAFEEVQGTPLDLGHPIPRVQQPSSNLSSLPQHIRPQNFTGISAMALMKDPDFAQTPEIAKWADLPSEERDAALETWMCEQLESESFKTLLKTLEGMWQRVFLGQ